MFNFKLICCLIVIVITQTYLFTNNIINLRQQLSRTTTIVQLSPSIIANVADSYDENKPEFDNDFADAMSKPLPQWYKDQKKERENFMKELERNRERILQEFRAKYDVTEEVKQAEWDRKLKMMQERVANKKKKSSWLQNALGVKSKEEVLLEETKNVDEQTTKEKWEKFWDEEEKQTGIRLPGFFEVFPELQFKWPTWARRKDGSAIECESDADCPFPQACCPHPIVPGDQFCCTGWGQRVMVPAYAKQHIQSNAMEHPEDYDDSKKSNDNDVDGPWGSAGYYYY